MASTPLPSKAPATDDAGTYIVAKRGPGGEPLTIQCAAHEGCTWTLKVASGRKRDDDPILQAQWNNHMREAEIPTLQAFGHLRRSRTEPKWR